MNQTQIERAEPDDVVEGEAEPGFVISLSRTPQGNKTLRATIVVTKTSTYVQVRHEGSAETSAGRLEDPALVAEIGRTVGRWLERLDAVEEIDAPQIIQEANAIIRPAEKKILVVKDGKVRG